MDKWTLEPDAFNPLRKKFRKILSESSTETLELDNVESNNSSDLLAKAVKSACGAEDQNEQINDQVSSTDPTENLNEELSNQLSNEQAQSNDQSKTVLDVKVITKWLQKFPCEHCGRQFSSKIAQDKHKNHCKENESNLYCDICDKTFSRVDTAKKHKLKHWMSKKKEEYRCLQCNVQCTTMESKSNHDIRRTNGIFFQCACGEKFCYKQHLRKHQETKKRNKETGHDSAIIGEGYYEVSVYSNV